MPNNPHSQTITQGYERAPNRAMLRAVGFGDDDFSKPIVGVANGYSTITPCNIGLNILAKRAETALRESGVMPQMFGTITVSDGISMGTEAMKYSLVSREVIADSIETACGGQSMDGLLAVGGCDKNMPGAMIAIARMNIPAIFVYGGTIKPGHYKDRDLTIVSAFEAVGEFSAGKIDEKELAEVERRACPGAGSCGGMFTANTMSSAIEAMGMSLPYSSTMAAEDAEKADSAAESARVLADAVRAGRIPRSIITRESLYNAIAVVMALGGSTNAVLHLLAIAHAADVPLKIEEFEEIRGRIPVLCDLKPSGRYVATDLHKAGGVPQVMKMLLEHGLLNGNCLTISGKTIAETLSDVPSEPRADQDVIRPWSSPMYAQGHLAILKGNLAEEGAVAKITGVKNPAITGPARVFESEEECLQAVLANRISPGDVLVIRYEGPKGGPGMREMLAPTSAIIGGTIALVREDDSITIDAHKRLLRLNVPDDEIARRRSEWRPPSPKYTRGVLAKYAKLVSSASLGAVTDLKLL
jgi:dihydroxy-acid dehydratase